MAPWHLGARAAVVPAALAAFVGIGFFGVYRYIDNYWLYRGFAPPQDPAYVQVRGHAIRIDVRSSALGGRVQPVDVYLPPGYEAHPRRRYPVLYLLHGEPGRPGAFLATVRLGVVEDELTALHRARPVILVMPFGSTGSFTDKEWANGVRPHEGWETFVARDVVRAVDRRLRTIRAGWARGIGGLSEGGYGAVNIALHAPTEFSVVESWSGYEIAVHNHSIFGRQLAGLAQNTPLDRLRVVASTLRRLHTYFWFYTGRDDPLGHENRAFASELTAAGIPHTYLELRGGHNWALWRGMAWRSYLAAARRLGHS
jgi:enterochelin esterase-like enzyme